MVGSPLVSIIIPTFNRAHLIGETLDSVLVQTYTNWECIIVDDCSTDHTVEVVKGYLQKDSRFHYHRRPYDRPKGANACRNYGFELSKGEYVNWFDDDDVMHHQKLFIQINALMKSELNFSVCQTLVFEKKITNLIGLRSPTIFSDDIFFDYLTQKVVWLTQSPIWRKEFLKKLDYLFDETLLAAQEWEFHCRVLLFCVNYNVINNPLVYIRKHDESITYGDKDKSRNWNYFLARKKVYDLSKTHLDKKSLNYLQNYFINNFKSIIRSRKSQEAWSFYKKFILIEHDIPLKSKFYSILAIFSFLFLYRGDKLLSKIKY